MNTMYQNILARSRLLLLPALAAATLGLSGCVGGVGYDTAYYRGSYYSDPYYTGYYGGPYSSGTYYGGPYYGGAYYGARYYDGGTRVVRRGYARPVDRKYYGARTVSNAPRSVSPRNTAPASAMRTAPAPVRGPVSAPPSARRVDPNAR